VPEFTEPWQPGPARLRNLHMRHTTPLFALGAIITLMARAGEGQTPAPAPNPKPMVEWSDAELVRELPELAAVQSAPGQDHMDALLAAARSQTLRMFQAFGKSADLWAAEDLHAMRFRASGGFDSDQHDVFRYGAEVSLETLGEFRAGANGEDKPAPRGFAVTGDFLWLLSRMLPRYQPRMRFRDLGRDTRGNAEVVVYTAQLDAAEFPHWAEISHGDSPTLFQGFIWIDSAVNRITRLRAELRPPTTGSPLQKLTIDARFGVVEFKSHEAELSLPSKVAVTIRMRRSEYYNVHRFSHYQMFAAGRLDSGTAQDNVAGEPDAREALVDGIVLLRKGQPAEAVPVLKEAVRLDPDAAEPHYHLGVALHETHDLAGAEAELREVVKRIPDSADGYRELGAVLFESGDWAGAAIQFRELIRLDPKDAAAHANLGEALVKLHDPQAVEEYRMASALAPENAAVKSRFETISQAAIKSTPSEPPATAETIKVDVRQVIVPVVVSDKSGHQVAGLRQTDFQVFENGVEQTIASFTVEHSEIPAAPDDSAAPASAVPGAPVSAAKATPVTPRHLYLICVDTLHASPGNFVHVREALMKLFHREQPGYAQYALITLGRQAEIFRQPTPDPSQILSALESPKFWSAVVSSDASSNRMDVEDFRRFLEETRIACETSDPTALMKCKARMDLLPAMAESLAQRNVPTTIAFLETLKRLVEQFPGNATRGELILISDGFLINPASESFGLLAAYFSDSYDHPGIRAAGLRGRDDRFQSAFDAIVRVAARHNVRIYTIDSRGLTVSDNFAASTRGSVTSRDSAVMSYTDDMSRDAGNALAEIAEATGGVFIHNTNDLLAGMQRVFADGRDYYVLSYVSKDSNMNGKFRTITIKLRDSKLSVRAKRGYWATGQ
jgi:VWFA-related protein